MALQYFVFQKYYNIHTQIFLSSTLHLKFLVIALLYLYKTCEVFFVTGSKNMLARLQVGAPGARF